MNYEATIAKEASPTRCQSTGRSGQCRLESVPNSTYCKYHGGNSEAIAQQKESTRRLLVRRWQEDIDDFAFSTNLKTLRDEIGVLRVLLEQKLNMCEDPMTLVLQAGPISSLVRDITRTIESCDKIESKLDITMDKTAVLEFATKLVSIVADVLGDDHRIDIIADRVIEAIR